MHDELEEQIGSDNDPFDLICHIAFDLPMLTRKERAAKAKKALVEQYSGTAREVIAALVDKYNAEGLQALDQAANRQQAQNLFKVQPFSQIGTPQEIATAFGGPNRLFQAIRSVSQQIYQVQ